MESLQAYLQVASAVSEVAAQRARDAARRALGSTPAAGMLPAASGGVELVATQISALADELVAASRNNRAQLVEVVRTEVESVLGLMGLSNQAELQAQLAATNARVRELERELAARDAVEIGAPAPPPPAPAPAIRRDSVEEEAEAAARQAVVKRAATRKATTKKAAGRQADTESAAAKNAATKQTVAGGTTARNPAKSAAKSAVKTAAKSTTKTTTKRAAKSTGQTAGADRPASTSKAGPTRAGATKRAGKKAVVGSAAQPLTAASTGETAAGADGAS